MRALGIAESYEQTTSTLAGAVVRADGIVDGLAYATCTVGGTDATEAVSTLCERCCRPDVQYVLCGAIAPAWYNLLDLEALYAAADRPVLAVTFEASDGLEDGLTAAFDGVDLEQRLERYRALPERRPISVGDETVYVRYLGCEEATAEDILEGFTLSGRRPEPIRVASLAASATDEFRRR